MTKVFAVNGSPNMAKGNTEVLLRPFLAGMEEDIFRSVLFLDDSLVHE